MGAGKFGHQRFERNKSLLNQRAAKKRIARSQAHRQEKKFHLIRKIGKDMMKEFIVALKKERLPNKKKRGSGANARAQMDMARYYARLLAVDQMVHLFTQQHALSVKRVNGYSLFLESFSDRKWVEKVLKNTRDEFESRLKKIDLFNLSNP